MQLTPLTLRVILLLFGQYYCLASFAQSSAIAMEKRMREIQGTYLIEQSVPMGNADMVNQYGRYIIYGDTFTIY